MHADVRGIPRRRAAHVFEILVEIKTLTALRLMVHLVQHLHKGRLVVPHLDLPLVRNNVAGSTRLCVRSLASFLER